MRVLGLSLLTLSLFATTQCGAIGQAAAARKNSASVYPLFTKSRARVKESRFCDGQVNAYTGYLDIGTRHFFFYFFESRQNPLTNDCSRVGVVASVPEFPFPNCYHWFGPDMELEVRVKQGLYDPPEGKANYALPSLHYVRMVVFWTNGGPGGSSSTGLLMENVSIHFTMLTHLAAISVLSFASLAAAAGDCSTGPVQCCNSVESADSAVGSALLSLLGVVLQDTAAKIGLGCSAMSAVGVGSRNACAAQTVCCENNNVGGMISIGCVPVSL